MKVSDIYAVQQLCSERELARHRISRVEDVKLATVRIVIDGAFQTVEMADALRPEILRILREDLAVIERSLTELGVEL